MTEPQNDFMTSLCYYSISVTRHLKSDGLFIMYIFHFYFGKGLFQRTESQHVPWHFRAELGISMGYGGISFERSLEFDNSKRR